MANKEETYRSLRERIITNALPPGHRLNEKDLMREYAVGRTPLREIFFTLREEGFIEIIPQVGTQVSRVDIQEIRNIIEVRRWLEQLVGQLATERILPEQLHRLKSIIEEVETLDRRQAATIDALNHFDTQFHLILYEATQNKALEEMLPKLLSKITRFWYYIGFQLSEFMDHFDDLRDLYGALENGDAPRVQQTLNVQLRKVLIYS